MSYKIVQHYVGPGKYEVECKYGTFTVKETGHNQWTAHHGDGYTFTKETRDKASHAMAAQLSLVYDETGAKRE